MAYSSLPKIYVEQDSLVGLRRSNEHMVVQKSHPLAISLFASDLDLIELKIFDAYLSRINMMDPEHRSIVFKKGEMEEIFGVRQIHPMILHKKLEELMKTTITVPNPDFEKGYEILTLFEAAEVGSAANGQVIVSMKCTPSAAKYIFCIEKVGYIRYFLKCVSNIKSRHAYLMYMYIKQNLFRKKWTINFHTFRKLMDCGTKEYSEFKRFNDKVLKPSQKELLTNCGLNFQYREIKNSSGSMLIEFTIIKEADLVIASTGEIKGFVSGTSDVFEMYENIEMYYNVNASLGSSSPPNDEEAPTEVCEHMQIPNIVELPELSDLHAAPVEQGS